MNDRFEYNPDDSLWFFARSIDWGKEESVLIPAYGIFTQAGFAKQFPVSVFTIAFVALRKLGSLT